MSNQDLEHGYNIWSEFYDRYPNPTVFQDELSFPPFWNHIRGRRVLEIGCGTGRHTEKLAMLGNEVTAVDSSEGMLAVARAKTSLKDVRFVRGDILLASPDQSVFDAVVSALVIEHISDLDRLFRRIACVLGPQGGRPGTSRR